MRTRFLLAAALLCFAAGAAEISTEKTAGAAKAFVRSLNEEQRGKVVFKFGDAEQRKRWSNLPTGIFKRAGLKMGELNEAQRNGVWAVLQAALSPSGYEKVRRIVEADEVLSKGDGGAGRPTFGKDEYYVSFLGEPSASEPWIIQFGGHHLALNITLAGNHGTLTPSHTGVQPAVYQMEGKTIRPLGQENDKAFALINALDETQRKQAIIGAQMRDLVLGPGRDGEMIAPEGVKGTALNDKQREMLLDLASEWVGIQSDDVAKEKMAELRKNIAETWFAWSGPLQNGSPSYFRIQGPTALIEYAPQKLGGDATKHIHTIYRDPTNEYGAAFVKR